MYFKNGKYYSENELRAAMDILQFCGDLSEFARGFGIVYIEPSDSLVKELVVNKMEVRAVMVYHKLHDTTVREAQEAVRKISSYACE